LDLGCGSGRDSNYYKEKGYERISVDASREMCRRASSITAKLVIKSNRKCFFTEEFDGVWASASLLHIIKGYYIPHGGMKMRKYFKVVRIYVK
jgi:SAM-dependent methyltransferase